MIVDYTPEALANLDEIWGAALLKTSRSQINRLLGEKDDITFSRAFLLQMQRLR